MAGRPPTGTVTFLFTDVEGSTALLGRLGAERYAEVLGQHRGIVRSALDAHGGVEVDTQGDSFFCAFGSARAAVECAQEVLERLESTEIRVRVGVHTGEALVDGEGYVGLDVHRAARIGACGHGGQAVLSPSTVALMEPGALTLRDLGEHRLKDLSAPVRLHQLGTADFPPLRTLFRTNLPVPATEFVGRDSELRALVERVSDSAPRLLTLTGPGGTGKTRLALQLAGELGERFPDGVRWAPLAPLRDPALVASAVAQAVEVEEEPDVPLSAAIAHGIGDRRLLLLVDNCEHLIEACAEVAAALLAGCPNLLVLATSREPLDVSGENVVPVEPLSRDDAVALFEARARSAGAAIAATPESRAVVTELCARLDELPLALELAAARAAAIPPAVLLERLSDRLDALRGPRDADERQRTLRAAIAWSHDLLEDAEKRLFRRLAVFNGGATLDAAEAVCEANLDDLASLVGKSLVRQQLDFEGHPRYWMLETIREFAVAELRGAGEAEGLADRHLDWFAKAAADLRARGGGFAPPEDADVLERDRENVRIALARAVDLERRAVAVELAGALAALNSLHGRYGEAEDALRMVLVLEPEPLEAARLESFLGQVLARRRRAREGWEAHLSAERRLAAAPDHGDPAWRAAWIDVKLAHAYHHYWHAEQEALAAVIEELEAPVAEHGSEEQRLDHLHVVLLEAYRRERYALSEGTEERARALHRAALAAGHVDAEFGLGFCLLWRGKPEEAARHLQQGLAEARATGAALTEVRCLAYGAVAYRFRGDVEGARELLGELERFDEDDDLGYWGLTAAMRAWVALRDGDLDRAEEHARAAFDDWSDEGRAGPTVFQWTARFPMVAVELARGRTDAALEHCLLMLDASQQPLPQEIGTALEHAVRTRERAAVESVLEVARVRGYV